MEKMKMESANITDMNIDKIAALFPNCITETADENGKLKKAINFDMLRAMLSEDIAEGDEAYEFTWVGKKAAIAEANRPIRKTLRPVMNDETVPTGKDSEGNPYCSSGSVNWDSTENLYIEGDNLEVLKLLQESYLGKVKMIYIDPPYNTGNDFIYRDDFAVSADDYAEESGQLDEDGNRLFKNTDSNGRFHSDWCSMIYSRLMLARNLLSDDGVIFISIDDNEYDNLKKICDEVFGLTDFRSMVTVIANPGGRDYGGIAKTTEYIMIYSKSESTVLQKVPDENHIFEMKDEIGPFELRELRNRNTVFNDKNRPNLCYPFYLDPNNVDEFGLYHLALEPDENHSIKVMPLVSNGIQTVWRWGKNEKSRPNLNINVKGKKKQDGTYMIVEKYRDENVMVKNTWTDKKFRTENGSVQVRDIMGGKGIFDYPKPIEIPHLALLMSTDKDSIILDFFSGSATTAHAVMQLNAEDGGHRKFVMVQLPEKTDESSEAFKAGYKNICEIGKERIRRAGAKIKSETGADIDYGFRVLKLDDTNMQDVYYTPAETDQQMLFGFESNIKPDRTDLDLLFGCLLDWGLPLSMPYSSEQIEGVTVHTYNDGDLIACFDKAIPESVIKTIAKRQPLRVVFRDDSFADSPSKINVSEIFKMLSPDTRVKVI